METFRDAYCRRFVCPPLEFERRVFFAVAYPHVRLLLMLGLYSTEHFSPDRALIAYCGILHSMRQLDDEVRDFARLPENRRFSRRVLLLRISGRRLKKLAAECMGMAPASDHNGGPSSAPFPGLGTETPDGA